MDEVEKHIIWTVKTIYCKIAEAWCHLLFLSETDNKRFEKTLYKTLYKWINQNFQYLEEMEEKLYSPQYNSVYKIESHWKESAA